MLKKNFILYGLTFVCFVVACGLNHREAIYCALNNGDKSPYYERERFRIVFESHRDGNGEIYVMDTDGRHPKNLTNSPEWEDGFPVCSPDGSKILFGSNRDFNKYGDGGSYVMNADGSNPRLIHIGGGFPRWSSDGSKIVYTDDNPGEIYVMDADGSNPKNLTNNPAHDCSPCWSPNGGKIAFHSNRDGNFDIHVVDADGSNTMNLTEHPANDFWPIWSPDSSKIAFDSNRDGNLEIYVMNADGSNVIRLTNSPEDDCVSEWSPDGRKIAFDSVRDWWKEKIHWRERRRRFGKVGVMFPRDMREIYVMDADGSNQIRLTHNRVMDRRPSWLRIVGQPVRFVQ